MLLKVRPRHDRKQGTIADIREQTCHHWIAYGALWPNCPTFAYYIQSPFITAELPKVDYAIIIA